MKIILYFLVIVLLLALNLSLFPLISIYGSVPNLLLVLIVMMVAQKDEQLLWVACLSGLFLDFYTGVFVGSFSIAFLLISAIFYFAINQVFVFSVNWKFIVGGIIIAVFITDFVLWGYNSIVFNLGWSVFALPFKSLLVRAPSEIIYDLLLLYPVNLLLRGIEGMVSFQNRKNVIR